eukprot:6890397-Prymnesium_polylepis.1
MAAREIQLSVAPLIGGVIPARERWIRSDAPLHGDPRERQRGKGLILARKGRARKIIVLQIRGRSAPPTCFERVT